MKKISKTIPLFFIISFWLFHPKTVVGQIKNTSNLSANNNYKFVALTFDDGPYGTSTEEILNILKKENVNATFFLIGKNVLKWPNVTKEIVYDGNIIGNHTYSHSKSFKKISVANFINDVNQDELIIASTTGLYPDLFRPPYGNINPSMKNELTKDGYSTVLWNVSTNDWNLNKTPQQIEGSIVNNVKPNSIILLHDGHETDNYSRENTVAALQNIIEKLKNDGYTFVTVDELIGKVAYFNLNQNIKNSRSVTIRN